MEMGVLSQYWLPGSLSLKEGPSDHLLSSRIKSKKSTYTSSKYCLTKRYKRYTVLLKVHGNQHVTKSKYTVSMGFMTLQ